jgi:hypothetical protein
MRVKKIFYENKERLIIFITLEEWGNGDIKKQIEEYKKLYKEVSVFISGNNSIKDILENMIQERMN